MKKILNVNGVPVEGFFPDETVENVLLPLVKSLEEMQKRKGGRLLVALAAPPGAGKSTLALFLENLSERIQAVGMDGFHFRQDYLLSHTIEKDGATVPLVSVKGAPESFDLAHLRDKLYSLLQKDTRFPIYDRTLHDVAEDAQSVTAPIVLMEGNWLLLNKPGWDALPFDYTVYMEAEEEMLRPRILSRRMKTGRSETEALILYDTIDKPNITLCNENHRTANLTLRLLDSGAIVIKQ